MKIDLSSGKSKEDRQQVLQLTLDAIKAANSMVSLVDVFRNLHDNNEMIRTYLGDTLAQRDNRKVRDLCLDVVHNVGIEVVKNRPLLIVRWKPGGVH